MRAVDTVIYMCAGYFTQEVVCLFATPGSLDIDGCFGDVYPPGRWICAGFCAGFCWTLYVAISRSIPLIASAPTPWGVESFC